MESRRVFFVAQVLIRILDLFFGWFFYGFGFGFYHGMKILKSRAFAHRFGSEYVWGPTFSVRLVAMQIQDKVPCLKKP